MKLDRVTMTGADESIYPEDLVPLSWAYPFVEWGILMSASQEGNRRFPSYRWLMEISDLVGNEDLALSGHLCGKWIRDLITRGEFTWLKERPKVACMFKRIQFNFHAENHVLHPGTWAELQPIKTGIQFIFQIDGTGKNRIFDLTRELEFDAVPLFDISGGAGITPDQWPRPIEGVYCGYAGGLGPDNLREQLERIAEVVGDRTIWIDMETRIRSDSDRRFDLDKVAKCLEIAKEWL